MRQQWCYHLVKQCTPTVTPHTVINSECVLANNNAFCKIAQILTSLYGRPAEKVGYGGKLPWALQHLGAPTVTQKYKHTRICHLKKIFFNSKIFSPEWLSENVFLGPAVALTCRLSVSIYTNLSTICS